MSEVARTRTPVSAEQLKQALSLHPDVDANRRALLMAHIWIETRNGKSLWNNNVGNLTAKDTAPGDYWRPHWYAEPTEETSARNRELHEQMLAGKAPRAFAAYPDIAAGVRAYLSAMRGRFATMWRADGPAEFVREWRNSGYTPGLDVEATTPGFTQLYRDFGGGDIDANPPIVPGEPDHHGGLAVPLAFLGFGGLLWWLKRNT